jgi:hypothetical protein
MFLLCLHINGVDFLSFQHVRLIYIHLSRKSCATQQQHGLLNVAPLSQLEFCHSEVNVNADSAMWGPPVHTDDVPGSADV